jgi:hypothetical protein
MNRCDQDRPEFALCSWQQDDPFDFPDHLNSAPFYVHLEAGSMLQVMRGNSCKNNVKIARRRGIICAILALIENPLS